MMKYVILFLPVIFSVIAQILVKVASEYEIKAPIWLLFISLSIFAYMLAFVLYSYALRFFPISLASPVNMIAVMIFVVIIGVIFLGEAFSLGKIFGIFFGIISILFICYDPS